jgi:hypothetical protein
LTECIEDTHLAGLSVDKPAAAQTTFARLVHAPVLQALLLTALIWPLRPSVLSPCSGLDCSWQGVLARSAVAGTPFGTHLVFSYGPLGFLTVPALYSTRTTFLSIAFLLGVMYGTSLLVLDGLRQHVRPLVAFVLAYLVASTVASWNTTSLSYFGTISLALHAQVLLVLAMGIALRILLRPGPAAPRGLLVGLGALGAVAVLVLPALAVGIVVILVAIPVCCREYRWATGKYLLLGAAPCGVIAWVATGNGPGNILSFAVRASWLAGGYASAMFEPGFPIWTPIVVSTVIDAAVVAWVAAVAVRTRPIRVRAGVGAITAVVFWVVAKESYVRSDRAHVWVLLALAPLIVACFLPFQTRRVQALFALMIPTLLIPIAAFWATGSLDVRQLGSDRIDHATRNLATTMYDVASSTRRQAIVDKARADLRSTYGLPPAMQARLHGQCVDVDPSEQNLSWAYWSMKMCTLPIPQDYAAYTPSLDHLQVAALAGPDAPRYILRMRMTPFDMIPDAWDAPAEQLAIWCHYRQVDASSDFQLLARTQNRCGPPTLVGRVTVREGQYADVPASVPGDAIVATAASPTTTVARLEELALRPTHALCARFVDDGLTGGARWLSGTSSDLHVLQTPSTLGYAPAFAPLEVARIEIGPELPSNPAYCVAGRSVTPVTFTFYRVSIH